MKNDEEKEKRYPENKLEFNVNGVNFEMILVQGGIFTMGATPEQVSDDDYEDYDNDLAKPTHQVTLSSYYIGKTEVTQALWETVMGNNPSQFRGDNKPVEHIGWEDCKTFISKLNSLTGKKFRLPTEAEWEFAARGGNKSQGYKYSGSNKFDEVAWSWLDNETHDVGLKLPNELGIYDMSGNVEEWCSDWYGNYSSISQINPKGPSRGADHVYRGGGWCDPFSYYRSSCRNYIAPDDAIDYLGIRLAISV